MGYRSVVPLWHSYNYNLALNLWFRVISSLSFHQMVFCLSLFPAGCLSQSNFSSSFIDHAQGMMELLKLEFLNISGYISIHLAGFNSYSAGLTGHHTNQMNLMWSSETWSKVLWLKIWFLWVDYIFLVLYQTLLSFYTVPCKVCRCYWSFVDS